MEETAGVGKETMKIIVLRWPDGTVTIALDREYLPAEMEAE